ncbi:hypothetical protein [Enterovibrio norvegicus]|uniref:hypothetical protein n=1 Tax=Enterovibrio norvegicus TaxID=188144 RepID=UPI0018E45C6A|nr:hypothetical protein [Enterovibrio norvegicus]
MKKAFAPIIGFVSARCVHREHNKAGTLSDGETPRCCANRLLSFAARKAAPD